MLNIREFVNKIVKDYEEQFKDNIQDYGKQVTLAVDGYKKYIIITDTDYDTIKAVYEVKDVGLVEFKSEPEFYNWIQYYAEYPYGNFKKWSKLLWK